MQSASVGNNYAEILTARLDFVRLALFFGNMPFLTPLSIRLATMLSFSCAAVASFFARLCSKALIAVLTVDL